jgi:hypothetical protein
LERILEDFCCEKDLFLLFVGGQTETRNSVTAAMMVMWSFSGSSFCHLAGAQNLSRNVVRAAVGMSSVVLPSVGLMPMMMMGKNLLAQLT